VQEEQTWQPPEWWYQKKRPNSDEAYFENMSRIIFQAGLNWRVIDQKWPTIKKAFMNFNIEKIASFTDVNVQELMKDAGIIRNKGKINAIIYNAKGFKAIKKQCG
jgi:DNA-3-methyladenine glycosylase I